MSVLRHWHPVLTARELRDAPRGVRIDGEALVVFRAGDRIGALRDVCPHRGGRLSAGQVQAGCVACPYHGWAFDADGQGRAPASPKLRPRTTAYRAVERHGLIWVRDDAGAAPFPSPGGEGWFRFFSRRHRVLAPLELVVDNFTEVEHTGAVHALFGYDPTRLDEVVTRVEAAPDAVRVFNRGPQKPLPAWLRPLVGVSAGDEFIDDWTTRFAPVHTRYEQWWAAPGSDVPRRARLRVAVFFTPVEDDLTDLFTLAYVTEPAIGRLGTNALLSVLLKGFTELEVRVDVGLLGDLADRDTGLEGRRLGRFDRVLGEHRRRIAALYRGAP